MSAGLNRKQYTALAGLADDLGVSYSTPEGSFNEKFCELCRIIIAGIGGTFTPVTGGSFISRKASYLRQVAIALGASDNLGAQSLRETFIKSAKAIWDLGNDDTVPDTGSSFDWRVYQYLYHSIISPADADEIIWYGYQGVESGTVNDVNDRIGVLDPAKYVGSNCLEGAGTITSEAFALGQTVVNSGTAIPTVANGSCSFGVGTIALITIDDVLTFLCDEGQGLPQDASGNGNHATANTTTWTTADDIDPTAIRTGFTPAVVVTSTGASVPALANEIPVNGGQYYNTVTKAFRTDALWSTRQSPALSHIVSGETVAMPTKSQIYISDAVNDKLTVAGLNGANVVTCDGTATPTAGAGEITFTEGTAYNISIDGELVYTCDTTGKTDTTLSSSSVSWGDATIATGAGGLDSFWSKRYYDVAGVVVDAENYLPITNIGGYHHNGAESLIRQASGGPFDAGTPNFFSADGATIDDKSYADYLAHASGDDNLWIKCLLDGDVPHIKEAFQYPLAWEPTPADYTRNLSYIGTGCGLDYLIPYPVTAGTGIGPTSSWYSYDGTNIYLVEDA